MTFVDRKFRYGFLLLLVFLLRRIGAAAILLVLSAAGASAAQSSRIPRQARQTIDKANAAWVIATEGKGPMSAVADAFARDAVFVASSGDIVRGRKAIEQFMSDRLQKSGPATKVTAVQDGVRREGEFIYEWGHAVMQFSHAGGKTITERGRYLTVWEADSAGHWRITRNLSLPY
jgi:uncharacterized protein (TIGR02246 family)